MNKPERIKLEWNNIWNYFSNGGFEDILLCKVMKLKNAKNIKMKLDECDDILRFTKKYMKKLERENE